MNFKKLSQIADFSLTNKESTKGWNIAGALTGGAFQGKTF